MKPTPRQKNFTLHMSNAAMLERQGRILAAHAELDLARNYTNVGEGIEHLGRIRERLEQAAKEQKAVR